MSSWRSLPSVVSRTPDQAENVADGKDPQGKVRAWQGEAGDKQSVLLALVSSRDSISRDR